MRLLIALQFILFSVTAFASEEQDVLSSLSEVRARTGSTNSNYVQDVFPGKFSRLYYSPQNPSQNNISITICTKNHTFDPDGYIDIQQNIEFDSFFLRSINNNEPFTGRAQVKLRASYSLIKKICANYEKFKKWQAIALKEKPAPFAKFFTGENINNWEEIASVYNGFSKDPEIRDGTKIAFNWDGNDASVARIELGKVQLISSQEVESYKNIYDSINDLISDISRQYRVNDEMSKKKQDKVDALFK